MIQMAAEANFKIDQLQIENELLLNKTMDDKSSNIQFSQINYADYMTGPSVQQAQRNRAGTLRPMSHLRLNSFGKSQARVDDTGESLSNDTSSQIGNSVM